MPSDSLKRKSFLFPFRLHSQEPTKFEVVNRKKVPFSGQQTQSAPSPTEQSRPQKTPIQPIKQTPSNNTIKNRDEIRSEKSTDPIISLNTHTHHLPQASPQLLNSKRSLDFPHHSEPTRDESKEWITSKDATPAILLNISSDIPPVPDSNLKFLPQPSTSDSRTISMRQRRKKPAKFTQISPSPFSTNTTNIIYDVEGNEIGNPSQSKSESTKEVINTVVVPPTESKHTPTAQKEVPQNGAESYSNITSAILPPTNESHSDSDKETEYKVTKQNTGNDDGYDDTNNDGIINSNNEIEKVAKDTPGAFIFPTEVNNSIQRPKLDDDDFIDELKPPHLSNTKTNAKSSSLLSVNSTYSEFYDADDHINESAENLASHLEKEELPIADDASSSSSNIIIKPLVIHKKTLSTASASSVPSNIYSSPVIGKPQTGKTHQKKLSLSDEILKDIEEFQPFLGINSLDEKFEDNISPVSPLKFAKTSDAIRSGLFDEESDNDIDNHKPSYYTGQNDNDRGSLFNDSSDQEESEYNKLGDHRSSDQSNDSSISPDINFESSHHFTENVRSLNEENKTLDFHSSNTENPADGNFSSELHQLNTCVSSFCEQLTNPENLNNKPEDVYSQRTAGDVESGYSYNQHSNQDESVLNTAIDNFSEAESSQDFIDRDNYSSPNQRRTFHVVNDDNYSTDDEENELEQNSFEISPEDDQLNTEYSVIHQQEASSSVYGDQDFSPALSFTAKSPALSGFTFEHSNTSDFGDSVDASESTLNTSPATPQPPPVSNFSLGPSTPLHTYDRRDQTVAPVQYISQQARSRRPPPSDTHTATRPGRSTSVTSPILNVYNSIQEDIPQQKDIHTPEKSNYVERLRLAAGTTNSDVSTQKWELPIGISEVGHSRRSGPASARALPYKKRSKVDLKHGKIKPRLLASEVDDDEDTPITFSDYRGSTELERLGTQNSNASLGGYSAFSGSSPRKSETSSSIFQNLNNNTTVQRSGTVMNENPALQAISLERRGTVIEGNGGRGKRMTLFIANPDADSD